MSRSNKTTFKHIPTNGIRLHVAQSGPAEGPLVILLHGFPEFWYGWRRQIPALARAGFQVWAPDQRGYNLSDKPPGVENYHVSTLAADVIGLLDAAGRENCFLVGHDWGAAVAWETAIRYPQRIQKLVILNVPHPDVMSRFLLGNLSQLRKSWYIFFFQIPFLPEAILRTDDWSPAVQMLLRSGKPGSFTQTDIEQYRRAWWRKNAMTCMINWYRAIFRSALRRFEDPGRITPRRVQVPTLMLWGKNDIALSHKMAQPSIDLCNEGRLIFFEDATHWVQHDEAETVNQQLLAFLERS
ncbi:MAG: alpha/beta hydrolase [Anaerolineales bacterium]|nr:alpha/beta hydrolase [Anaerolineales bacterium]